MTQTFRGIRTDVFIIGTGPGGCTFARFLVPAGLGVVMAEMGEQLSFRPGAHLKNPFKFQRDIDQFTPIVQGLLNRISVPPRPGYTTTLDPTSFRTTEGSIRSAMNPRQNPYKNLEAAAASYTVGGMLTHWTNNTPRHHPTMERIPFIAAAEWDLLYGHAEAALNTRRDVFIHSVRHTVVKEALQAHYGARLPPGYEVQELPVAGQRRPDNEELVHFSGSDTILAPLLDVPGGTPLDRFRILPQHRVKKLLTKGDRVECAVVDDLIHGEELRVYADIFVAAAGAVATPQLLHNSGMDPEMPALGRYLTEHPMTFTQIVLSSDIVGRIQNDPRFKQQRATLEPLDPVPIPMKDPPPMVWIPVSDKRPWHCQIHRDSFQYGGLPPDVDSRLIVDLRWFGMATPDEANRVKFESDINDKFGMPQPTFEFSLSADDRRRAHEMMGDMVEAAQCLGGFFPGSEPRFMPPGTSLHLLSTYRMGNKDDGTSVTDPDSRTWRFRNLYLGGNGLIPTKTASNPTLTSVALATKAAHAILGIPVPKPPPPSPLP